MAETPNPASRRAVLFGDDPSTADVVAYPAWCVVREAALCALARPGLTAILGVAGTGKSMMLRDLERSLAQSGRSVRLLQPEDFDPRQGTEIVLVDGADRLPDAVLAALAARRQPCVVAGSSGLATRLAGLKRKPLQLALLPLPPVEAAGFLHAQLERTGQAGLLGDDAVAALIRASSGVPRRLQLLAGLAVFLARLSDAPRVTAAHVAQAALIRDDTHLHEGDTLPEGEEPSTPRLPPARAAWHRSIPARTVAAVALGGTALALLAATPTALRMAPVGRATSPVGPLRHLLSASAGPMTAAPHAPASPSVPAVVASLPEAPRSRATPSDAGIAVAALPAVLAPRMSPSPEAAPAPVIPAATAAPPTSPLVALPPLRPVPDETVDRLPPLRIVSAPAAVPPVEPPAAAAEPPLPALPELRILVRYVPDDAGAEQRADQVIGAVHRLGFAAAVPKPVPARSGAGGVVYFFAEDEGRAVELARALGGSLGVASLAPRAAAPSPRPGTVEITLPPPAGPVPGAASALPVPAGRAGRPVRLAGVLTNERFHP